MELKSMLIQKLISRAWEIFEGDTDGLARSTNMKLTLTCDSQAKGRQPRIISDANPHTMRGGKYAACTRDLQHLKQRAAPVVAQNVVGGFLVSPASLGRDPLPVRTQNYTDTDTGAKQKQRQTASRRPPSEQHIYAPTF